MWDELGSNFILFHMIFQLSEHHLLKRLFFPHCEVTVASLLKISWLYVVRFLSGLSSVPLVFTFVLRLGLPLWLSW